MKIKKSKHTASVLLLIYLGIALTVETRAQGTWTWVSGSSAQNPNGNFGIQSIPATTNQPPGLYEACEWTDQNGNFWIFGGSDFGSFSYAALWRYDINSGLWTWMSGSSIANASPVYGIKGTPSTLNHPGARTGGICSWTDLNGDLWLFGGQDVAGNLFNDLWRYTIATNEWTWMSGSSTLNSSGNFGILQVSSPLNAPPCRHETSASWVDNGGRLWMFGGATTSSIPMSDMWMYDPATNQWTWMSGQQTGPLSPNYGTLLIPSPANTPGARLSFARWKDKSGNFWLYGGTDILNSQHFSDMWMYNPVTNFWTWMAGNSTPNSAATFTQKCISANGLPRATYENRACWTDDCGRFWSFGGLKDSPSLNAYNAFWMFDPVTLQFTWINGVLSANAPGNFGVQNIPSIANIPPALFGSNAFKSINGEFWMFGGYDAQVNAYNTLWRYQIDPNCPTSPSALFTILPDSVGCTPYTAQFTPLSLLALNYNWDFGDVFMTSDTSDQTNPSWTYNQPGNYDVTLITESDCGYDTSRITLVIANPPVLNLGSDTSLCAGQSLLLNSDIIGQYIWNTGDTTSMLVITTSGSYSLQVTDTFNCVVNDTVNITLSPLPTPNLGVDTAICNGQTVLLNPGVFDAYQWNTGDATATLIANTQGNYSVQVESNNCFNSDTVFIRVDEEPTIGVGTDSVRCNIVLDAGNPGASYLWNTGETTQTITATQTGTYSITITNGVCVVVDSITINGELGGGLLYIPNAFTPDQNGLNEKFQPVGTNIIGFSMSIYNRWGELVYATNDITKGWDGRLNGNLVQQDVYVYVINYSSDCLDGKHVRKIGQVDVIR